MVEEVINSGLVDRNIEAIKPLPTPAQLIAAIPNGNTESIGRARKEVRDILHGRDNNRLVAIVGPCSMHEPKSTLEYAERLRDLNGRVADDLLIVMRTYPEKPRTTVGWTGLLYDPNLDGSNDVNAGLRTTRQVLADVNALGLPCAVELLDPFSPQFLGDLVSWGAVGARTTESQSHRQLASGVSAPVGFKNSTEGDIKVAIDAMVTASSGHRFIGINLEGGLAVVETKGNPDTHLVLRGGNKGPNYNEVSVQAVVDSLRKRDLLIDHARPIMIDCSHGNSSKDHTRQPLVARAVMQQIQDGQHRIMGIMLESNLREGRQDWVKGQPLKHGVSITDACIGWEDTEKLLVECAQMVRPRVH